MDETGFLKGYGGKSFTGAIRVISSSSNGGNFSRSASPRKPIGSAPLPATEPVELSTATVLFPVRQEPAPGSSASPARAYGAKVSGPGARFVRLRQEPPVASDRVIRLGRDRAYWPVLDRGGSPLALVGNSYGAAAALIALANPDRVRLGLVRTNLGFQITPQVEFMLYAIISGNKGLSMVAGQQRYR